MDDGAIGARDSWFTSVEIEVNARCNRRCSYCPVSVLPTPQDHFMSEMMFNRIIHELARITFRGNVSYHLYNEPLLRRDLEELAAKVAEHLPGTWQILYTNGDLLSDSRYVSLKRAGINHFVVTSHDSVAVPHRPDQTVLFPTDLALVNRGGFFNPLARPFDLPCYAPADKLTIAVNGDVLLCCNDANKSQIMGNIERQDLEEIWLSAEFIRIRRFLKMGNRRDASPICRQCDDREYSAPGENNHIGEREVDS